jgi:hypothetical protein
MTSYPAPELASPRVVEREPPGTRATFIAAENLDARIHTIHHSRPVTFEGVAVDAAMVADEILALEADIAARGRRLEKLRGRQRSIASLALYFEMDFDQAAIAGREQLLAAKDAEVVRIHRGETGVHKSGDDAA